MRPSTLSFYRHSDEHKELKSIPTIEKNEEIPTINSNNRIDHKASKSSTTVEITHQSINVKKRKKSSFLKSL